MTKKKGLTTVNIEDSYEKIVKAVTSFHEKYTTTQKEHLDMLETIKDYQNHTMHYTSHGQYIQEHTENIKKQMQTIIEDSQNIKTILYEHTRLQEKSLACMLHIRSILFLILIAVVLSHLYS